MSTVPEFTLNNIASGVNLKTPPVAFPDGTDISNPLNVNGSAIIKILIPNEYVGTSMGFFLSNDGITYFEYVNAIGEPIAVTAPAGKIVGIPPIDFLGVKNIKFKSNALETGVILTITTMDIT